MDTIQNSNYPQPRRPLNPIIPTIIIGLLIGGVLYAWQQYTFASFNREITARVDALTQVIENQNVQSETVTETTTTISNVITNTELPTTQEWKEYNNPSIKVKFLYPSDFAVVEDKIMQRYTNGTFYHRVTLENTQVPEKPKLIFEYNPSGFGFSSDKVYTLSETNSGAIILDTIKVGSDNDTARQFISTDVLTAENGAQYFWLFEYSTGEVDWEPVFQKIINNFILSK